MEAGFQGDDRAVLESMGAVINDQLRDLYARLNRARRALGVTGPIHPEVIALLVALSDAIPAPQKTENPFDGIELDTQVYWRVGMTVYSGLFRGVMPDPMGHMIRVWPFGDSSLEQIIQGSDALLENPMVTTPRLVDELRPDKGEKQITQADLDKAAKEAEPEPEPVQIPETPVIDVGSKVCVAIPGQDLFEGRIVQLMKGSLLSVEGPDGKKVTCHAGDVIPVATAG